MDKFNVIVSPGPLPAFEPGAVMPADAPSRPQPFDVSSYPQCRNSYRTLAAASIEDRLEHLDDCVGQLRIFKDSVLLPFRDTLVDYSKRLTDFDVAVRTVRMPAARKNSIIAYVRNELRQIRAPGGYYQPFIAKAQQYCGDKAWIVDRLSRLRDGIQ